VGALRAPWVKRVDLMTGAMSRMELDPAQPFVTARVEESTAPGKIVEHHYAFDGQSWFAVGRQRVWAIHGTSMSSGTAVYVFMEYGEARHPDFEAALARGERDVLPVYADWLEEQGDPYAAALKPELLKAGGPAGRWFLEGLDRDGRSTFELDGGLVKRVELNVDSGVLHETMHRLCHLRACLGLEEVQINSGARDLRGAARWSMWREFRWPASMRTLGIKGLERAAREELDQQLSKVHPHLRVKS